MQIHPLHQPSRVQAIKTANWNKQDNEIEKKKKMIETQLNWEKKEKEEENDYPLPL